MKAANIFDHKETKILGNNFSLIGGGCSSRIGGGSSNRSVGAGSGGKEWNDRIVGV